MPIPTPMAENETIEHIDGRAWFVADAAMATALFREWLGYQMKHFPYGCSVTLAQLRGHDLCCWCPLVDKDGNRVPCHADVLLELANAPR